jgi:hypothetical protein
VQLSFALFLCSMDFEAEQKECDDGVIIHASRERHNPLQTVVCVLHKITRVVDLLCALRATLASNLTGNGIKPRRQAGTGNRQSQAMSALALS